MSLAVAVARTYMNESRLTTPATGGVSMLLDERTRCRPRERVYMRSSLELIVPQCRCNEGNVMRCHSQGEREGERERGGEGEIGSGATFKFVHLCVREKERELQ